MMANNRPTLESIVAAASRLRGVIHRTPLVTSRSLSQEMGAELRFKAENLQVTGSFKIRGAFNKVAHLAETGVNGVVAASSGNHGQAVAWAARYFQIPSHIVVPTNAPAVKVQSAQAYGATVEHCGTTSRERLARAQELAEQRGYALVPPYDDPLIMSGQGTVGLEILEDWPEIDAVVVPIGGGGLISGIATAIKASQPQVRVIGVEPAGAAKALTSRQAGHRIELNDTASIADGLITLSLGQLTHPVIETYVDDLIAVSDEQIARTFWQLITRLKLIVEPSGAAAAAYALSGIIPPGQRTAVVISGGNVDPTVVASLVSHA